MRRLLAVLACLLVAGVALPPLWFMAFPVPAPELPPAGHALELAPGLAVNVLDRGKGQPVVLVHGHPGTAYDWVPLQKTLAALGHRVLAYDRVGYGRSDARRNDRYTLDQNAEELLAVLELQGLRDVTVVGWSYGGGTAIVAAKKDPTRISRVVLVGSVGPGIVAERRLAPDWVAEALGKPLLRWVFAVPPLAERFGASVTAAAFAPEPVPEGYRQRSQANFARPGTFESFVSEGTDLDTPGLLDPEAVPRPILVVHGDADQLSSLAIGEGLHERARNSELWVVRDGGHMLPLTRTRELAERIHTFATDS